MDIYNDIDFEDKPIGLIRQNAMTFYKTIHPFLIEAIFLENMEVLYYLIRCKGNKWIQITIDSKETIMKQYTKTKLTSKL